MSNNVELSISRFAILREESDNNEEDEKQNAAEATKKKKRNRKNKKKSSQNTQDLRNLAFSKPVSAAAIQSIHRKNHAVENVLPSPPRMPHQLMTKINKASESVDSNIDPKSWEDWKSKDEAFVLNKFQSDMETALRLSSAEIGTSTASSNSTKIKKKNKHPTMSFDEYCQISTENTKNSHKSSENRLPPGYAPEEVDPNHFELEITTDEKQNHKSSDTKKTKLKKKKKKEANKATLSDLLSEETSHENTNSNVQQTSDIDSSRFHIWQSEIEEKNKELQTLKDINKTLKEELSEVKKRNKQLCFILAQGEMKEKSVLVQQVNELNNIKTELSTELQTVCSLLEQERSKVSHLRQELTHLQGSRMHTRSISEEKP